MVHVALLLVTAYLVILPMMLSADDRLVVLLAYGALLLGVPVYFLFSWDRLRPRILDAISGKGKTKVLTFVVL